MLLQLHCRTLLRPVGPFTGLGLFSGKPGTLRVFPASDGVRVRRISFDQIVDCPLHVAHVTTDPAWAGLPHGLPAGVAASVLRNTTLQLGAPANRQHAGTVEHIASALAGLGITSAMIELEGPEVPILDGSALDFARELWNASSQSQSSPLAASTLHLREPVIVRDVAGGASLAAYPLVPGEQPSASYELSYDRAALPPQRAVWTASSAGASDYLRQIAPARTFSFLHEAQAAQSLGLFRAFSPRDLLVLDAQGSPIDNAWRIPHEPAHHKLLDLLGDLALLGRPLAARVVAVRSGHALTHALCRALLASDEVQS